LLLFLSLAFSTAAGFGTLVGDFGNEPSAAGHSVCRKVCHTL
jgi:hypothetical protein